MIDKIMAEGSEIIGLSQGAGFGHLSSKSWTCKRSPKSCVKIEPSCLGHLETYWKLSVSSELWENNNCVNNVIPQSTVCTGKGAQSRVTHPIVLCTFWDLSCVTGRYVHLAPEVCHTFLVSFGIILLFIVIFRALCASFVHSSQVTASLVHHVPYVTSRCLVHLYLCVQ